MLLSEISTEMKIDKLAQAYSKKHPIVGEIICGNGAVLVLDRKGTSLTKMDWKDFDSTTDGSDEALEVYQQVRDDAENDQFIKYLRDLNVYGSNSNIPGSKSYTPKNYKF